MFFKSKNDFSSDLLESFPFLAKNKFRSLQGSYNLFHGDDEAAFVVRGGGVSWGVALDVDAESLILGMVLQPARISGVVKVLQ